MNKKFYRTAKPFAKHNPCNTFSFLRKLNPNEIAHLARCTPMYAPSQNTEGNEPTLPETNPCRVLSAHRSPHRGRRTKRRTQIRIRRTQHGNGYHQPLAGISDGTRTRICLHGTATVGDNGHTGPLYRPRLLQRRIEVLRADRPQNRNHHPSRRGRNVHVRTHVRRIEPYRRRQSDHRLYPLLRNEQRHSPLLHSQRQRTTLCRQIQNLPADRRATTHRNRTTKRIIQAATQQITHCPSRRADNDICKYGYLLSSP